MSTWLIMATSLKTDDEIFPYTCEAETLEAAAEIFGENRHLLARAINAGSAHSDDDHRFEELDDDGSDLAAVIYPYTGLQVFPDAFKKYAD